MNRSAIIYDNRRRIDDAEQERHRSLEQLKLVARGDNQAFADLYNQYSLPIYNYLYHLVYDTSIAEELLQEVFFVVWKGAKRFRGDASVKTWIYRIAYNQAVSWLRKHECRNNSIEVEYLADEVNPEQMMMNGFTTDQILMGLNQLSTDHRTVIELAFFHEFSYRDIAIVMDCPIGTVKSRISYARKYLTKIFTGMGLNQPE